MEVKHVQDSRDIRGDSMLWIWRQVSACSLYRSYPTAKHMYNLLSTTTAENYRECYSHGQHVPNHWWRYILYLVISRLNNLFLTGFFQRHTFWRIIIFDRSSWIKNWEICVSLYSVYQRLFGVLPDTELAKKFSSLKNIMIFWSSVLQFAWVDALR